MEQCINAGLTIAECSRAAVAGRAGDVTPWLVAFVVLALCVLTWRKEE